MVRRLKDKESRGKEKCPVCGAAIEKDSSECGVCHTAIGSVESKKKLCRTCGAVLGQDTEICISCGTFFGEDKARWTVKDRHKEAMVQAFSLIPGIDEDKAKRLYAMGFHSLLDLVGGSLGDDMKSMGLKRAVAKRILAQRGLKEGVGMRRCPDCDIPMQERDVTCTVCGAALVEGAGISEGLRCPSCNTLLVGEDVMSCYACGAVLKEGGEVYGKEFETEKALIEKGLMHLVDDVMEKFMINCPVCWEMNSPTLLNCTNCGCQLEVEGREFSIRQFMALPGVGRDQAEQLYRRGYRDLIDLIESLLDDDAKARGIGWNLARQIILSNVEKMEGDLVGETKVFCPICNTMYIFVSGDVLECDVCSYKKYEEGRCEVCVYKKEGEMSCNVCNAPLMPDKELGAGIEDMKNELGKVIESSIDIISTDRDVDKLSLPQDAQDKMVKTFSADEMREVDDVISSIKDELLDISESDKKDIAKAESELEELMSKLVKDKPEASRKQGVKEPMRRGLFSATVLLKGTRDFGHKVLSSLRLHRQAITAVKLKQYRKAMELTKDSAKESVRVLRSDQEMDASPENRYVEVIKQINEMLKEVRRR